MVEWCLHSWKGHYLAVSPGAVLSNSIHGLIVFAALKVPMHFCIDRREWCLYWNDASLLFWRQCLVSVSHRYFVISYQYYYSSPVDGYAALKFPVCATLMMENYGKMVTHMLCNFPPHMIISYRRSSRINMTNGPSYEQIYVSWSMPWNCYTI